MISLDKLQFLYMQQSKHSNYQVLSSRLNDILGDHLIKVKSRYEQQRLIFIVSNLDFFKKKLLDIGGNTGFFTFELIDRGVNNATLYEGNSVHANFVCLAAEILKVSDRLTVINDYLDTPSFKCNQYFDVALMMNVLHHLGDDYGSSLISLEKARKLIIQSLQHTATFTKYLVVQIGYCWKGNRDLLLFNTGTKQEQIDFMMMAINDYWNIINIGIPERQYNQIVYTEPSKKNMIRQDELGEFLNRPLFILESKLLVGCCTNHDR